MRNIYVLTDNVKPHKLKDALIYDMVRDEDSDNKALSRALWCFFEDRSNMRSYDPTTYAILEIPWDHTVPRRLYPVLGTSEVAEEPWIIDEEKANLRSRSPGRTSMRRSRAWVTYRVAATPSPGFRGLDGMTTQCPVHGDPLDRDRDTEEE